MAVTELLLAAGSKVLDIQKNNGFAPLHFAAQHGHAPVMKLLIAARCCVDLQQKTGATAVFLAASQGHEAVTKLLIEARCNVDLPTKISCTPLHSAAQGGYASVTKQLIAARCKIDFQNKNGSTAIHAAAESGHASVTEQLEALTDGWQHGLLGQLQNLDTHLVPNMWIPEMQLLILLGLFEAMRYLPNHPGFSLSGARGPPRPNASDDQHAPGRRALHRGGHGCIT